ncbi:MAG: Co2+/Mg2+ efflux protein ApaG [Proteobacteria bacterium]|nr:Co2+/Mg2+ efflux protein ApaG [Pseudomonadota bacterium]
MASALQSYTEVTKAIRVSVEPVFLEHQSSPDEQQYAWAYSVTLENTGKEIVQLISRHWKIADANGVMKEVRGPGVVGEQPVLKPGQKYEYTSGTLLHTSSGVMFGTYQMVNEEGQMFDIAIPAFSLDMPAKRAGYLH